MAWSLSTATVVAVDSVLARRRKTSPLGRPAGAGPSTSTAAARRARAGAPWLVLVAIAVVWEVLAIDTGRRAPHLTVSALALAFRPLEAALYLVWLGVGLLYGVAAGTGRKGAVRAGSGAPSSTRPALSLLALLLPHSRAAGVAFWVVFAGAALATEGAGRLSNGRTATATEALSALRESRGARIVLPLAWAYAGWHLFAH